MFRQVAVAALGIASLVVPIWAVLRVVTCRVVPRKEGGTSAMREAVLLAAVLYVAILVASTLYPLPLVRHRMDDAPRVNAVPLLTLARCVRGSPAGPPETRLFCAENVVGNIILFVPLGVLVPLVWPQRSAVADVSRIALAVSVSVEATQYAERWLGWFRSVDVDDVLFNVVGASIGCLLVATVARRWSLGMPGRFGST
jgi:glycopeptide antibiotics resistance protein